MRQSLTHQCKEKANIWLSLSSSLSWQGIGRPMAFRITLRGLRAKSTHRLWENQLSSISSKDGPRFSSVASSGILPGGTRAILHSCSSLRSLEHLLLTSFTRLFGGPILNFISGDTNSGHSSREASSPSTGTGVATVKACHSAVIFSLPCGSLRSRRCSCAERRTRSISALKWRNQGVSSFDTVSSRPVRNPHE